MVEAAREVEAGSAGSAGETTAPAVQEGEGVAVETVEAVPVWG
jgi:hypothetical protein